MAAESPRREKTDKPGEVPSLEEKSANILTPFRNPNSEMTDASPTPDAGERLPRRGFVGLPRATLFKRQESEQRERLAPLEATGSERRTATHIRTGGLESISVKPPELNGDVDEKALLAAQVDAPVFDDDNVVFGNGTFGQAAVHDKVSDASPKTIREPRELPHPNTFNVGTGAADIETVIPEPLSARLTQLSDTYIEKENDAIQNDVSAADGHNMALGNDALENGAPYNDASAQEVSEEQIRQELGTKWILERSSMPYGQRGEKFYVTYAETPNKWRKIILSCDYRNAPPDSLEHELKAIQLDQRAQSAMIYVELRSSLPYIQFYDTVTNLRLETRDERLYVHVTEDANDFEDMLTWDMIHEDQESTRRLQFPNQNYPWRSKIFKSEVSEIKVPWTRLDPFSAERQSWNDSFKFRDELFLVDPPNSILSKAKQGLMDLKRSMDARALAEKIRLRISALSASHVQTAGLKKAPNSRLGKFKQGLMGYANGADATAMADTGSRENIMSASYAKKLGLKVKGSASSFKIGNSQKIKSLGSVSIRWAFADSPKHRISILCHVLPSCTYDLILGNSFLKATETLTTFRYRLTKCLFTMINNVSHFGFLGETYERLEGTIADAHHVLAVPDTGADRNVMSLQYAIDKGLEVKTEPQNRGYLQFADGSFDETMGQVETHWTFATGERIAITFEVLRHCCSDVIIGEDILTEHNVFQDHAGSILSDLAFDDEDFYELAPFDFVNFWQRGCNRLIEKLSSKKHPYRENTPAELARIEEQHRRDVWNHKYDFGASASAGENALEQIRRERYCSSLSSADDQIGHSDASQRGDGDTSMSQQSGMPIIPSIPTSQSRR